MGNIIYYAIMLIITIISFILGKYVFPNVSVNTCEFIEMWASKFVVWAKQFLSDKSGEEKMNAVVSQLQDLAQKNGIKDITEDQIRAVAQYAYEQMVEIDQYRSHASNEK